MTHILQKAIFRFRFSFLSKPFSISRVYYFRLLGMSIGKQTYLGRIKIVWPHQIKIGSKCIFEDDVFLKFDGQWQPGPSIQIADGCFIGRGVEFNIRKRITVGHGCGIASGCKFIDHDHGITGERLEETPGKAAEIMIGDYVWLGCNVVVLRGVAIGNGAVVGAGAVVTKNIPAGEIWAGVPARKFSSRVERSEKKAISL